METWGMGDGGKRGFQRSLIAVVSIVLSFGFSVSSARAQSWLSTPASGDWNTATNWDTSGVPNGSSAIATFGASSTTLVSNTGAGVTLDGIQFGAGASSYAIVNTGGFTFQGVGITDLSGKSQTVTNYGHLLFQSSSTAGDLTITGTGGITFTDSSTAGQAAIDSRGTIEFDTQATAENSSIDNQGQLFFLNNASAGQANLVNNGTVSFGDFATAGSATLTTSGVGVVFSGNSSAGNASITNTGGLLQFDTNATAGNAFILNQNSLAFLDAATAGSATLVNQSYTQFSIGTNAGTALITNEDHLLFNAGSSAATARITNDGTLVFYDQSTAADAAVTTGSGGHTIFLDSASGGAAQFITHAGGTFDASGVTTGMFTMDSYTQGPGGTLQLAVGSGAQDAVSVGGDAALGGSLSLVFKTFSLAEGDSVTLLTAADVTGLFEQWNNPLGARLFPFYQPTFVYLESVLPTFQVSGLTTNENAVAQGLDGDFEDTSRYNLMANLVHLPETALPAVFKEIDPSGLTSLYQMGFEMARFQGTLAAQRLEEETATPGGTPSEAQSEGGSRFAADMPAEEERALARKESASDTWKVFLNGYGGFGTLTGDGNGTGYKFSTGGLVAGMDQRLGPHWTGGLFLGYGQGSADIDGGGKVDSSGGQLGLYAGWHDQGFHMEAVAQAGLNSYKTQQAAYGGAAFGDTNGQQYSGKVGLGYGFRLEELKVESFASGQYTYLHIDGFRQSGSNAPLEFPGQGEGGLLGDLGLKVSQPWKWDDVTLGPTLTAAWEHVYQGNQEGLSADFGGAAGSFAVKGSGTGRDGLVLGINMDAALKGGWKIFAGYQGRIGMTNYAEQNWTGGIKTDF